MSKIPSGPNPITSQNEIATDNPGNDHGLTRTIQVALAIYLLPALAMVLFVGFAMIAIGAVVQACSWLASLLFSPWGLNRRPEASVSGAWIYRVNHTSVAHRWQRHSDAVRRDDWHRRPGTDVLN